MLSVFKNSWALLLGMMLLMVGNGLQSTLLGVRGGIEQFLPFEMSLIMSAYFIGFLGASRMVPSLIRRVGHVRVFAALASFISAVLVLFPLYLNPVFWIFGRLIIGFCFCGVYIIAESWLNNAATNENRGQSLSLYLILQMVGIVVGQGLLVTSDPGGYTLFIIISVSFSMGKNGGDSVEIFAEGDVKNFEGEFGDTGAVISSDLVQIALSPKQLELTGTGRFDQVPFTAKFQKGLGPDQADVPALLEAELYLSSELVSRFTGAEIEGLISGSSPAQITASLPSGTQASFSLSSDLVGLGVNAKQINWQKPAKKPAQFRLTGRYNNRVLTDTFSLTGAGLNLEGAVDYAEQEEFKSLSISKLQVDDILDVFGQFNPAMGIEIFGGWVNFPNLIAGMPGTNTAQTAHAHYLKCCPLYS